MDAPENFSAASGAASDNAALAILRRFNLAGHMAGAIAHDFNNILTGILGNLELMQRRADRLGIAEFNDYLAGGRSAAARGVEFTQTLLAIAGLQPLEPKAIELDQFAANIQVQITAMTGDQAEVTVACGADLPGISCDEARLEDAVLEFAKRAMAPPAARHLTLSIERRDLNAEASDFALTAGTYVAISLEYDGAGMSDDEAAHAFEPFYGSNVTPSLGLAKTLGFIRQSQGHAFAAAHQSGAVKLTMLLPASG